MPAGVREQRPPGYGEGWDPRSTGEPGFMPDPSQCCPQARHRPFHKLHSLGHSMETQALTGDRGQAASLLPI